MAPEAAPEAAGEAVRIRSVEVLADDWALLRKTTFDLRRRDGTWQTLSRETYDRGDGAVILLYDPQRRTVVLTRQFRYPAFAKGHGGFLIEAPAGLLDAEDPAACIRREVEEETGYRIDAPRRLFEAFMSPGSVTERLVFFAAAVRPDQRRGAGGGDAGEGEDIEVLELPFDTAYAMIASGGIADGKTIMLLQHAKLAGLFD
ncbi:MAG TPA: NUDIX domain-containing protein [Alphaproteobacteria bacterium]|nr:NUDIX domain-containing protein [Alphaproteobacteria bacterium]